MTTITALPRYDRQKTYQWNYDHAPSPVAAEPSEFPGSWSFCGLPVDSPLGMPAGPLLNGQWCLYYASLGFDVLTYKTVRSVERECYPLPNLQPVDCTDLSGGEIDLPACGEMRGSWAVSFGMPSKHPRVWRADVERTRKALPQGKILVVSVVGTVQEGWSLDDLADDYAQCAQWAAESGADVIETNFSCPNVSTCDGQLFQHPQNAATVAAAVHEKTPDVPFIVKIGHLPSEEEAQDLLQALAPYVDGLAMTNSVAVTVRTPDGLLFDGQKRGICGEAIRKASLAQVQMVSKLKSFNAEPAGDGKFNAEPAGDGDALQLIAVGGAGTAQHVQAYLNAGASAVHLATAAMADPGVGLEIRRAFAEHQPD